VCTCWQVPPAGV